MAVTVTFARDAVEITLPAPAPGARVSVERMQGRALSAGGTEHVHDSGVSRVRRTERFENLTAAQKESLAGFFKDTARGGLYSFTYTDSAGAEHDARFGEAALAFERVGPDCWDAAVDLVLD